MAVTVLVVRAHRKWPKKSSKAISRAVRATIKAERALGIKLSKRLEIGVRLSDDAELQTLNRLYRQKDRPTNVLSFPLVDTLVEFSGGWETNTGQPFLLGDLVLSFETTLREALERKVCWSNHLIHLVVHGTLHLLGYDHERSKAETVRQEEREIAVLAGMGLVNPYL